MDGEEGGVMMRVRRLLGIALISLWAFTLPGITASADVVPGDVIDKSNWQKIEGLVPEPLLNWVKQGDSIKIGELDYNPAELYSPAISQSLAENVGKYELNKEDVIVDVKTGKLPEFIVGIPFPVIDLADPKAGQKIMHNKFYYQYGVGNTRAPFRMEWIGRGRGFERAIEAEYSMLVLDSNPAAMKEPNPDNELMLSSARVVHPPDISGTNVLAWRYRDERPDYTHVYVPAIRRLRRMSAGSRSDSYLGSDMCVDDNWGYAGKVSAFEWKVLRKEEQLVPFCEGDPLRLFLNDEGEWETAQEDRKLGLGYEVEGYQGAPWLPLNVVYVKRPTYVLECKAKDRYYNYGTVYLWVDADVYLPAYKVIHDRAGDYWKSVVIFFLALASEDGKKKVVAPGAQLAVDDRSRHGSIGITLDPKNTTFFEASLDRNDFSLGGFQKLCK
jgi:hypothetical protein